MRLRKSPQKTQDVYRPLASTSVLTICIIPHRRITIKRTKCDAGLDPTRFLLLHVDGISEGVQDPALSWILLKPSSILL